MGLDKTVEGLDIPFAVASDLIVASGNPCNLRNKRGRSRSCLPPLPTQTNLRLGGNRLMWPGPLGKLLDSSSQRSQSVASG